jgi:hypothetical protein
MHGQKGDLDGRIVLFQFRDSIKSVEVRHCYVRHYRIRPEHFGGGNHRPPIFNRSDYFKLVCKEVFQALNDDAVIVGQQNTRTIHLLFTGR